MSEPRSEQPQDNFSAELMLALANEFGDVLLDFDTHLPNDLTISVLEAISAETNKEQYAKQILILIFKVINGEHVNITMADVSDRMEELPKFKALLKAAVRHFMEKPSAQTFSPKDKNASEKMRTTIASKLGAFLRGI